MFWADDSPPYARYLAVSGFTLSLLFAAAPTLLHVVGVGAVDACMKSSSEAAKLRDETLFSDDQVIDFCKVLLISFYVALAYICMAVGYPLYRVVATFSAAVGLYGSTFWVLTIGKKLLGDTRCSWSGAPVSISGHFFFFTFFLTAMPLDALLHLVFMRPLSAPPLPPPSARTAGQLLYTAMRLLGPRSLAWRAVRSPFRDRSVSTTFSPIPHTPRPSAQHFSTHEYPHPPPPVVADSPSPSTGPPPRGRWDVFGAGAVCYVAYLLFLSVATIHGFRTYMWGYHSARQVSYGVAGATAVLCMMALCRISKSVDHAPQGRGDAVVGGRGGEGGADLEGAGGGVLDQPASLDGALLSDRGSCSSRTCTSAEWGGVRSEGEKVVGRRRSAPHDSHTVALSPPGAAESPSARSVRSDRAGLEEADLDFPSAVVNAYCCCWRARLAVGCCVVALVAATAFSYLRPVLIVFAVGPTLVALVLHYWCV